MNLRRISMILGLGLLVFFIANVGGPDTASGLIWVDAFLGVVALTMSVISPEEPGERRKPLAPLMMGGILLAMGFVAMSSGAPGWFSWAQMLFGLAFVATAVVFGRHPELITRGSATTGTPDALSEDETRVRDERSRHSA